ncbi:MAG: ABC transporter ATP-binding protein [Candidatus Adiutrix sp.]|jgi:putative ABC transport system ATP-binding protein|nr:ABC transporter ATP-binding protein [Candidatus Adiutrix sp.]
MILAGGDRGGGPAKTPAAGGQEFQRDAVLLKDLVFFWPGQARATLRIPRFAVPSGGKCLLSGPSGSGKSTLLSLIGGILTPNAGSVTVGGQVVNTLAGARRDAFRGDNIGFIFQQFNLVPYLSIRENVLIPCRLSARRRARAAERGGSPEKAAAFLLERLDMAPNLWRRPVTKLSVGQQQRVAAARALIGSPPLIIADEPTSALDAEHRLDFLRLLIQECESARASLIFVSHDQSLARIFNWHVRLAELNTAGA